MPYKLKGRRVLITGGSRGLGAEIARKFAAEGCSIAINYANNAEPAHELGEELYNRFANFAAIIQADMGIMADCDRLVEQASHELGGPLDIIIANAGWTKFTDFGDLHAMTDAEWDRCWAVNVKGMKQLLAAALPGFREKAEGGVFIITSSIAGVSLKGSSMAYSVTKAAQLHLMKCMAQTQGDKVRINAVLPGLLLTDWGNMYGEERLAVLKDKAVLKKETDLGDCADMYVSLAKNTSITGQTVQVDSGLEIANM